MRCAIEEDTKLRGHQFGALHSRIGIGAGFFQRTRKYSGQTARVSLVDLQTLMIWMRRLDEEGERTLIQTVESVNRYPDFVRNLVRHRRGGGTPRQLHWRPGARRGLRVQSSHR
jgi:hypothetical protein